MKRLRIQKKVVILCSFLAFVTTQLLGGVIILDGTDSNDHGSPGAGGWLYMQSALNNIYSQLNSVSSNTLNVLDTTPNSQSQAAIAWAFSHSQLATAGWTINYIPTANVGTYLSTLSVANTGILYIPTVGNTSGDLPDSALVALTANASQINSFTAAGGGLFAEAESPVTGGTTSYQWVKSLIPGLVVTDGGSGGFSNVPLTITPDGQNAFPGLTNSDLSTGPWHNYFGGELGGLKVLATGVNDAGATVPVILGNSAAGSSITDPGSVPEPGSFALLGVGLALGALIRRNIHLGHSSRG